MKAPRIMIAAGKSGSGKTMITCGILRALQKLGKTPVAFKCGPDYIDPMFHERVVKTSSRNLDPYFTDEEMTRYLFGEGSKEGDLSVFEGVMGYYDGLGGISTKGSAYDLARTTKTPVILVVDARGMSVSALAWIRGIMEYRKDSQIAGVIFNRMSKMLYQELSLLTEQELGIACIGYVPEIPEGHLESRHLGLVLPDEVQNLSGQVDHLAEVLLESLDFEKLLDIAYASEDLTCDEPEDLKEILNSKTAEEIRRAKPVIAVAKDEAFCFIYRDNLNLLSRLGAELIPFSPLHDRKLPENVDGLLLYGGYPELYARELSENKEMRDSVRNALQNGISCLAECGGYMYLSESLEDMHGNSYEMAGAVKGNVYRTEHLRRFGYIELTADKEDVLGSNCGPIRSHEFHYFDSTDCGNSFHAVKPLRKRSWDCIHATKNMIAGFPHLYYYACPKLALEFLKTCVKGRESGQKNWKKEEPV
ncbi:MAG: cobyrinate a,c-diamide synthase [Fusicatenibacter sp.]|nr:cobyrinate a,c-diamide synthase [Lachnospiraceae bacterium]MDY2938262.1 cobyrinate a,c-diamide synthase [Fusicatenibacter sp.]